MAKKRKSPRDKRLSQAQGLRTRAKRYRSEAKSLREQAREVVATDKQLAKELRSKARNLSTRAKSLQEKNRQLKTEVKLERIARQTPVVEQPQEQFDFWEVFIETAMEKASQGPHGRTLSTTAAISVRQWLVTAIDRYGTKIVGEVCRRALTRDNYIFDSYIYMSSGNGVDSHNSAQLLEDTAAELLGQDFDSIGDFSMGDVLDDSDGTEEMYD